MSSSINVAIVGHSSTGLNQLEQILQDDPGIDISRKLLRDNAVDPFEDLPVTSSVVILDLSDNWRAVLDSVAGRVRRNRTPILLVGPDEEPEMMRLALRAGARDFQTRPLYADELMSSVHRLANEQQQIELGSSNASLAVFISAKGGAGASSLVTALGYSLARRDDGTRTLLVDLDLQYGNLPLQFDESSTMQLTQALISNERIDATLFDACVTQAQYGIDILSSYSNQVFSPWEIPQTTVANLFNLISDRYDQIVVDIPRQLDPITYHAVEMASEVCIVMQQTLSDLRQTRQIIGLLRDQGVPADRLRVVINRFDKRNVLLLSDIQDAFDGFKISTLPNDFKKMSFSRDNAVPLLKKYGKAPLSKSVLQLAASLFPEKEELSKGFFAGRRSASKSFRN